MRRYDACMGFFAILIALLLEQARPLAPNNLAHAAMRSWARSAGHRSNMLHSRMQHVGIGQAVAADGRTVFWAMVLAAPR